MCLLQRRKDKKSAIRFLAKLLGCYPAPRVAISDKLPSYRKPIKNIMPHTEHRTHKRLNNRVENTHQATRRKEKCWVKFKSPKGVQTTLSLMGKTRNIFSVTVGRYSKPANERRAQFKLSMQIGDEASHEIIYA